MRLHLIEAPLEYCAFVHDSMASTEVLHVFGDIDIPNDTYFEAAVERSTFPNRDLVIDFTGCTYMGAAGLSVLVRAHARLGERLRLAVPAAGFIARLLSVAQMQGAFTISTSLESALVAPPQEFAS